jgi:hypothetical protein
LPTTANPPGGGSNELKPGDRVILRAGLGRWALGEVLAATPRLVFVSVRGERFACPVGDRDRTWFRAPSTPAPALDPAALDDMQRMVQLDADLDPERAAQLLRETPAGWVGMVAASAAEWGAPAFEASAIRCHAEEVRDACGKAVADVLENLLGDDWARFCDRELDDPAAPDVVRFNEFLLRALTAVVSTVAGVL